MPNRWEVYEDYGRYTVKGPNVWGNYAVYDRHNQNRKVYDGTEANCRDWADKASNPAATTLFDIDNLDACTDSTELRELAEVLVQYARYASHKANAVDDRISGNIVSAMSHEDICDEIYREIPTQHRKW